MGMIEYRKIVLLVALWLKPTVVVSNTELLCPHTSLDAEVDKMVILPCWTEPKMDVRNRVEWVLNDTVDVHLLRKGKPDFEHQGKDYKNSTSLFDSELPSGNCSLRLKTEMSHTGRYRCSVRIGDETKHCFTYLTVHPHLNPTDGCQQCDTTSSITEKPKDGNNTGSTNTLSAGAIAAIATAGIISIIIAIIFIAGVISGGFDGRCPFLLSFSRLPCRRRFEGVRQNDPDAPVAHNGSDAPVAHNGSDAPVAHNGSDAPVAHNGPVQAVEGRAGVQEEPNNQNEGEEGILLGVMGDQNLLEQGHL